MTASSGKEAVANANRYTSYDQGMCLKWTRGPVWELGSLYGSAQEAWNGAKHKHPGDRHPPDGAPVFWAGGSQGYGHVAPYKKATGGPRSTDCTSPGRVNDCALDWPTYQWGLTYLGWAEDLNGVKLPLGEGEDMGYRDWAEADKDALATDVANAVWAKLLKGMDDAPDGRAAGPTLSNIHNWLLFHHI